MQPNTRILGLHSNIEMHQSTDILHCNINTEHLDRRGHLMFTSHTSMAIANVKQAEGCGLNNVYDGKLVSIAALLVSYQTDLIVSLSQVSSASSTSFLLAKATRHVRNYHQLF